MVIRPEDARWVSASVDRPVSRRDACDQTPRPHDECTRLHGEPRVAIRRGSAGIHRKPVVHRRPRRHAHDPPPRRETMRLWWNCGTRVGLAGLVTWMAAGSLVAQAIAGAAGYPV